MGFDLLAPVYPAMEVFLAGKKLHRCRTAFLGEIRTPQKILLLGEGHGRGLVECIRRFPSSEIVCLEACPGMIRQARRALESAGLGSASTSFVCCDVRDWDPPSARFDLIVSSFFLDCFCAEELERLIPRIARSGTPDAQWLVADFQLAASGWRRCRSRAILWLMYRFFRLATGLSATRICSPDAALVRAGFRLLHRREYEWGLLKSEWWGRG